MIQVSDILVDVERPERLEARYRAEPEAFAAALRGACAERPGSLVLQVWRQRLFFQELHGAPRSGAPSLPFVIGLCGALGLLVKLPDYSPVPDTWWYPRFAVPLVVLALIAYFLRKPGARQLRPWVAGAAAVAFAYVALLPPWPASVGDDPGDHPDSVIMAYIHLPLLVISLAGISFAGPGWRRLEPRMDFLRYGGELVVLTALILLGGIVLSGLTIALFRALDVDVADVYLRWAGICGACAAPVVGTYLYESVFGGRLALARVLAQVFSPLFLLLVAIYLVAMVAVGKSPYQERDFLIVFNGLLLLVLGLTVFSLTERGNADAVGARDHVNVLLVGITLLIDVVALSAILFRLGAYGFTPNRIVVLGSNLLVFGHLVTLMRSYLGVVRGRSGFASMTPSIAGYLPAYTAWGAFVVFLLPPLCGYR
jgi:hypothetical protein